MDKTSTVVTELVRALRKCEAVLEEELGQRQLAHMPEYEKPVRQALKAATKAIDRAAKESKHHTVIGLHDGTGEVYADHFDATDPHEAIRLAAAADNAPSQILGAIPGKHQLTAACEDSGKAAYIEDLQDDENKGDDLCDACGGSGVEIDHTHDGKTVCVECAKDCELCQEGK